MTFTNLIASERVHFKLTEKQKISEIGPSKLKLWAFKSRETS